MPSPGELADPFVDLGLADDVDASGRLVEEKDPGPLMEEPGQRDFLLIPSGQAKDPLDRAPGLDLQPAIQSPAAFCCRATRSSPRRR